MFETEKKLKDGIRSLQVENGMLITKINDYMYAYNDLKKQNEALKEELVRCYRIHDLFNSMPEQFKELESLKEENKKRKEQIEFLKKEYNELRELWCATDKVNRIYENKLHELMKGDKPLYADWFVDEKIKENKEFKAENESLKSKLNELVDLSIKNSLAIVSRCQKLNDENKQLKEENEALTRCVEKGMDCIDTSLLEQVSKLEGENRLLNHKLSSMKDQLSVLTNEREKQKIKAYHYDMYRNSLAEECVFNKDVNIGSSRCSECPNNRGCDDINHWVKCALIPSGKPKK